MKERQEALKIMEALSGVDEELLERSEAAGSDGTAGKERHGRLTWGYWCRRAAVFALIAVGAVSWGGYMLINESEKGSDGATGNFSGDLAQANGEEAQSMQANYVSGVPGDMLDGSMEFPPEPMANYSSDVSGSVTMDEYAPENGSMPEPYEKVEQDIEGEGMRDCDGADLPLKSNIMESCQQLEMRKLTEGEARELETLGAYVPSTLPSGYAFESACYDAERGTLMLCWSRGMDSVMLSVRQEGVVETVDVTRPELYDERLYEIPYAESVPQEYWGTFNSPVFSKDDFSLEIVRSRVISYSGDSGDTSTPRGSFSMLYDDGVLVRFSGRGTPEQIWEMFASIPGEE